jgi:hypothetical protein
VNLSEIIEPGIVDRIFADKRLAPKKSPTPELAAKVAFDTIKREIEAHFYREIATDLLDAVVMYELQGSPYGDYNDIPEAEITARSDYESAIDDCVETTFEKYQQYMSASWLGENCVETELWLDPTTEGEDARKRLHTLCEKAGKECFKNLTFGKKPAQVLASAAVTAGDLQDALDNETAGENPLADTSLEPVIAKMFNHLGKGFDVLAVYDDINEVLTESDEILCASAADRIGLKLEDAQVLQLGMLDADTDDYPNEIVEKVSAYSPPKGNAKKTASKPAAPDEAGEDAVDAEVLMALKDCGVKDTVMAEAMGVSRTTYTKWCGGKHPWTPTPDEAALVRDEIVKRANRLLAAVAVLDGSEAAEII